MKTCRGLVSTAAPFIHLRILNLVNGFVLAQGGSLGDGRYTLGLTGSLEASYRNPEVTL